MIKQLFYNYYRVMHAYERMQVVTPLIIPWQKHQLVITIKSVVKDNFNYKRSST